MPLDMIWSETLGDVDTAVSPGLDSLPAPAPTGTAP
jgi:hypothetical protein